MAEASSSDVRPPGSKRKEIYTYTAPWLIYGMNWSVRADQRFRLAIGSFEEEYNNSVRIVQLDEESHQFVDCGGFEHPYPTTKIMWMPDPTGSRRDLLATTGDYLRLWNVMDNKSVRLEALLNNVRAAAVAARARAREACRRRRRTCRAGYLTGRTAADAPCSLPRARRLRAHARLAAC